MLQITISSTNLEEFMEKLFDPNADYLSCEKNVKKYLKSIPDSQLKTFYENLEYTPFPILLIKEYKKRFSKKTKLSN